jgi:hypothetical protein
MPPVALIQEIGAYAGLVALPAFLILAVLHLSQARDVRRLREWAGRAPERAQQQAAAQVASAQPARPVRQPAGAQRVPAAAPAPATASAPTAQPPAGAPAAPPATTAAPAAVSPAPDRTASPAPATAAATAVEPKPAAKQPPWARDEHFGLRGGSAAAAPSRLDVLRERVSLRVAAAVGAVLVAIIVVVVLAAGGSSSTPVKAKSTPAAAAAAPTVAILNGTGVPGLGHKVGARVQRAGYHVGQVGDASGRQGSPSVVLYASGDGQAAQQVARSLGVGRTAPADAASESRAHGAGVIVVVGTDLTQGGAP